MRICSINLRGFNSHREKFIFDYAKSFDLVLIQETLVYDPLKIDSLCSCWAGPSFWSPALGRLGGVAILVNDNFPGKVSTWHRDLNGHVLSLVMEINDVRINLVNIYAPVNLTELKAFFESLHQYFLPASEIILGGDLNCYESQLDKFGGNITTGKFLTDIRKSFNLVDVWRQSNPNL